MPALVSTICTLARPRPSPIATDAFPHSLCLGQGSDVGSVLVSCGQGVTAHKIELLTGSKITATIGPYPANNTLGICSAFNRAWLANMPKNQVAVIDFSTAPPSVAAMGVGGAPRDVCSDGTSIWVTESTGPSVSAYNPATLALVATLALPSGAEPYRIRYDGARYLYVTDFAGNRLWKIDCLGPALVGSVAVGTQPWGVWVGSSAIYVANYGSQNISKINKSTFSAVTTWNTLGTTDYPHDLLSVVDASGNVAIVVDCSGTNALRVLADPGGAVLHTFTVGNDPAVLAFDPAGWIYNTNALSNEVTASALAGAVLD